MLPAAGVEWSGSSSLSSLSLYVCLEQAKILLLNGGGDGGNVGDALVLSVFEGLFRKISAATDPFSMGGEGDEHIASGNSDFQTHMLAIDQVIELMIANASAKSVVLEAFIRHIAALPSQSMLPFIDAIPAMFGRCDNRMIEDLAGVLFSTVEDPCRRDRSEILLRLLHALSELPLSKQLAYTVTNLTYAVMEDAVPAEMSGLLRIVLRSESSPGAGRAIFLWRDKLSRVPIEDLGPVIDRLWDIIPQCTGGAATLLEQIASQEKCIHSFVARGAKKEKAMHLSDLAIASIILSRVPSLITPTRDLLRRCLLLDRVPTHSLALLLRKGGEVGKCMGRVLWDLCVSLLDQSIPLEVEGAPEGDVGKLMSQQLVLNNNTSKLSRLVGSLYSSCRILRHAIVTSLLSQCLPSLALYRNACFSSLSYSSASARRRPTNDDDDCGNLVRDVLPLGQAFKAMIGRQDPCMQSSISSHSDDRCEVMRRAAYYRCCLAACLLRDLSADHDHHHTAAAVGSMVRSSLMARLEPGAMGSRRRQPLPAPFITATLMDCAVMGASHLMERSSFIATIHKLLALDASRGTSTIHLVLDNLFGRSSSIPVEGRRAGLTRDASAAGTAHKAHCSTTHPSPAMGSILACKLLLNWGIDESTTSLLTSVVQSSSRDDSSLLSAIDGLSACLHSALMLSTSAGDPTMMRMRASSPPSTTRELLFCNALSSCLHRLSLSSRIVKRMRSSSGTSDCNATVGGLRSFWLSNELRTSPEYDEAASHAVEGGRSEAEATGSDCPMAWDLADLSSTMARTTTALSRMSPPPGEEWSAHSSMAALSSTLFHLVQKVCFSHYLIMSMRSDDADEKHSSAVKLSFQMEGSSDQLTPHDDFSNHSALGCSECLSSDLSTRLLVTWSAAAADAFVGDSYVLPAGLTATQALMLAWERGLLVAVQAGRLAALRRLPLTGDYVEDVSLVKPLLVLLCQLHSCRLMLRAVSGQDARCFKGGIRSMRRPSRGSGHSRRGIVQSTGSSRIKDDRTEHLDKGKRAVLQLHEELEAVQKVSLQRLLRRSLVSDIPVRIILVALQCVLKPIDINIDAAAVGSPGAHSNHQRSQKSVQSGREVLSRLRTDAGLSIVSLYLYREAMRARDQHGAAAMLSSNNSFISVLRPDDAEDESAEHLNAELCTALLSTLPSLLSALEESRLRSRHRERGKRNKDDATGGGGCSHVDVLEGCFGNVLDRCGLKVLVLLLLKLLDMKIATMHTDSAAALANQMDLSINSDISIAHATAAMGSGREVALYAIYNTLERHLLPQHDSTITAVGVRILYDLIGNAGHGPSTAHRKVGSLAWRCFRSVYSESMDVGLHHLIHGALHGLDDDDTGQDDDTGEPPGMDDMWTQLADLVSRQTMRDRSVAELTHVCDKSTLGAIGLMSSCFSTHNEVRSMRPNSSSDQLRDCMAYRQLWLYWWVAESPNQRVYGVALLLHEALRCLCSGGAVDGTDYLSGNSPARELHADNRVRSMKAAEYMLHHSPFSATRSATGQLFPFVSHSTVEFHLQLTLSLLPALLILSSPIPASTPSTPLHTPFNPYVNQVHVSMLTVWTFDAFTDMVVDQQEFLGLIVNLSHQIFKVVRCILNGSPLAVTRMVEWRSRQPLLDGGYRCDGTADINDPGSMHYLQHAIRWTTSAVKHVASFVDAFHRVIVLSGQFDPPRSLVKALPGIQLLIERTLGRLMQLCHVNSADISPRHDPTGTHPNDLETTDPPVRAKKRTLPDQALKIGSVGDKEMQMRMKQFLEMHDKRLSEPICTGGGSAFDDEWDPATTDADAPGSMLVSVAGGGMGLSENEESVPQFGFVPAEKGSFSTDTLHASSSSSASGWGLYEATVADGNEDEQGNCEHDQWSGSVSDKDTSYGSSESAGSEYNS